MGWIKDVRRNALQAAHTAAEESHVQNVMLRPCRQPPVFGSLALLRDEKGKTIFRVESGPLAEVMSRIEERANYGETASGRCLADEFAKEPFGWGFEAVRLVVLSLLRSGKFICRKEMLPPAPPMAAQGGLSRYPRLCRSCDPASPPPPFP